MYIKLNKHIKHTIIHSYFGHINDIKGKTLEAEYCISADNYIAVVINNDGFYTITVDKRDVLKEIL